ncbi:RNA-binding protein [Halodesulfurarchaeum formicicum]|uniref:RNA-binding protein n=1 Tax=Halodesulfurarchaeum formicicum TaxID=1873524 RepID=A0A1D8S5X0_9EURY|nr:RNA-binding protein [Halodesulfurarchaeum formicicum]AOW80757.1 RNA-binding protein [Halodesulfurarchaeum formicicum]
MEVSSRHHLRSDEVAAIEDTLANTLGIEVTAEAFELAELTDADFDVGLIDGDALVWYPDDEPFLTVKGANVYEPTNHVVTVDTGAISFVSDGADVMRPGITEADPDIEAGDLVIIVEETHGKALAIGRALTDGEDMVGEAGKVVESLHHVGDELFEFEV